MNNNLFDFYYSQTQARLQGFQCHSVNGKPYTEAVISGQNIASLDSDLVLVASAVEMSAVSYNRELSRKYQETLGK